MKKKTKRSSKWLLVRYCVIFCWGVLFSAIGFFPFWIQSTTQGKDLFILLASKSFDMPISIESLKLSWFGKQSFRGVTCHSQDETAHFTAQCLDLQISLPALILRAFPKKISIKDCTYTLKITADGIMTHKQLIYDFLKHSRFEIYNGFFHVDSAEDGTSCSLSEIQVNWMKGYGDGRAISSYNRVEGSLVLQCSYGQTPSFSAQVSDFPSVWFKHMELPSYLDFFSNTAFLEGTVKTTKKEEGSFVDADFIAGSLKTHLTAKLEDQALIFSEQYPSYIALGADSKIKAPLFSKEIGNLIINNSKSIRAYITKGYWALSLQEERQKRNKISFQGKSGSLSCALFGENKPSIVMNNLAFKGSIKPKKTNLVSSFLFEYDNYQIPSTFSLTKKDLEPWQFEIVQKEAKAGALFTSLKNYPIVNEYADHPVCLHLFGEADYENLKIKCICTSPSFTSKITGESTPSKTEISGTSKIVLSSHYASILGESEAIISFNGKSGIGNRCGPSTFSFDVTAGKNRCLCYGKTDDSASFSFSLNKMDIVSHFSWEYLNLEKLFPQCQGIELKTGTLSLNFKGEEEVIKGKMESMCDLFNQNTTYISIPSIEVKDYYNRHYFPDFFKATIEAKGNLEEINPDILNHFLKTTLPLSDYLGDSLDSTFDIKTSPTKKEIIHFAASVRSSDCEFSFDLGLDNNYDILSNSNGHCIFYLTPKKYDFLLGLQPNPHCSSLLLKQESCIEAHLSNFSLPKKNGKSLLDRVIHGGLNAKVQFSPLIFSESLSGETIEIHHLNAEFSGETMCREGRYSFTGNYVSNHPSQQKIFPFFCNGVVYNLMERDKIGWNPYMSIQGAAAAEHIPVSFLSGLLQASDEHLGKMKVFFGDIIDLKASWDLMELKGPVTLDFKSPNVHAVLPLDVQIETIKLCDDLKFSFHLNDQIAKIFLKSVNPLIISGTYSDKPILFQIDAEDFSFPFKTWDFKNIVISKATLDLGKIYLDNRGQIQKLFEFLKKEDNTEKVEAWFSPLFFSLHNGILYQRRFDVLLDHKIHVALWGKTDIANDKLKLTLGIAPSVLQQRFNLPDLSKKDFFQVKMRGSFAHPELDWTSAYARIGILMARSSGGHLGYVVGSLADQLFSVLGDNAPPQTVSIFPWDKERQNSR